jgi:hypothetical protein
VYELGVHLGKRRLVDPDLHEGRLDVCSVDPALELTRPSRGQLLGVLRERMAWQVFVLRRAVVAGVRQDVHTGCSREPHQQPNVTAEIRRRTLDQRLAPVGAGLGEVGKDDAECPVRVVPARADLIRADEVHEQVLVHQRQAEAMGAEWAGHRRHEVRRWRSDGLPGPTGGDKCADVGDQFASRHTVLHTPQRARPAYSSA